MLRVRQLFEKSDFTLDELGHKIGCGKEVARKSAWQFLDRGGRSAAISTAHVPYRVAASAMAVDLTRIERRLAKEPVYQAKPKYCLLVFGPEAKTKVWLVIDSDTLYVDRNGNGDVTEKDERVDLPKYEKEEDSSSALYAGQWVAKVGNIHDGRFLHSDLEIGQFRVNFDYMPTDPDEHSFKRITQSAPDGIFYGVMLAVETCSGRGRVGVTAVFDMQGVLTFTDHLENAPVIHFDGPLQMGLRPLQKLMRGDKPTELHSWVGTPGVGAGTFAALNYGTNPGFVPEECHPLAEIEFPGMKAVRTKIVLDRRC